jgi:predicted regulator of Ras-like GTPase activity (Roadblock/LC7/MglB family)
MTVTNAKKTELATQCLFDLHKTTPEVRGFILASIGGIVIASTLPNDARIQRIAAVSAALFLLSEHAADVWGRGQALEVRVKTKGSDDIVLLRPVGSEALLITVQQKIEGPQRMVDYTDEAIEYLKTLLSGSDKSGLRWQI